MIKKHYYCSYLLLLFTLLLVGKSGYSQNLSSEIKLTYTIQVEGLSDRDQATRLENNFKQKTGILSAKVNFESKTLIVTTTKDITYSNICDVLLADHVKAQNYVVKQEDNH